MDSHEIPDQFVRGRFEAMVNHHITTYGELPDEETKALFLKEAAKPHISDIVRLVLDIVGKLLLAGIAGWMFSRLFL